MVTGEDEPSPALVDRAVGTIFPLDDDDGGFLYGSLLIPGGSFTLTFRADGL